MQVSQALTIWLGDHRSNFREKALRAYLAVFSNLSRDFGERNLH
jgi:hypothetical protein